jgi:hypothetical protein
MKISEKKTPKKGFPEKRIDDLKRRAEELTGGQLEIGGLGDCPAEGGRGILEVRG